MPIPRLDDLDSSVAMLREGYAFGARRFARHQSDLFRTRVMLREAVFMYGEEAARAFYEPDRLTRRRALPITALSLLLDLNSVSMLDGDDHRWRKAMFMSLMTPTSLHELADIVEQTWRSRLDAWSQQEEVTLLDAVPEVLCEAVCRWSGVPLDPGEVGHRTDQFRAMINGAGAVGPRNWLAHPKRVAAERWARALIEQVRAGELEVEEERALAVIASHRQPSGELLELDSAGVELINVLRPTVAVARFIVFAALAVHRHPQWRERVATDDEALGWFVQEVRRYYPFFPMVGGRALEQFEWRGHRFERGTWLLLDLYATNHDPRIWNEPAAFTPERFRDRDPSAFDLIPQGGGDHELNHRCAGEWITIELMQRAVRLLTTAMRYDVPTQDLSIDLSRMPAQPKSGMVVRAVTPL